MPDDLRTELGTVGNQLPGGQLRRVALARMLAGPAELLVMDDVSSALDGPTEEEFWRRLLDTGSDRTYLVVSNRRSVLERADRVVLLSEGSVAAAGTLADVLGASAEMRALCAEDREPPVSPR